MTLNIAVNKLALAVVLTLVPVSGAIAQRLSSPNVETPSDSTLVSPTTGVDYAPLRNLLANQQWRQANKQTMDLILKAVNRQTQGWLTVEQIDQLACWDLQTIDRLWKDYSQGRFGFSVQFPIFIETGNKPGNLISVENYEKFGDRVGWRKDGTWIIFRENLTYNLNAPLGHLPAVRPEYQITGGRLNYTALTKRMVDCNLVTPPSSPAKP
jgi:hypothetical protein